MVKFPRIPHFNPDDFRLLFLDIDDVLNSVKSATAHGGYPWPSTSVGEDKKFRLNDPPVDKVEAFDKVNVKLIENLCRYTNTHIVLSSTWRNCLDADQCRTMLGYIGLPEEFVIGRTCMGMLGWSRGDEIEDFMEKLTLGSTDELFDKGLIIKELSGAALRPKSYVIIDDMDDMLHEQRYNFVHVAAVEGLTLQNVIQAGKILTKDDNLSAYRISP